MKNGIKVPMALFRKIKNTDYCRKQVIGSQYTIYTFVALLFESTNETEPITITLNNIWNKTHDRKCTQFTRNKLEEAIDILSDEHFITVEKPKDNRQEYKIYLDEQLYHIDELYFWLSLDDFKRTCNELTLKELWLYLFLLSFINIKTKSSYVGFETVHESLGMSDKTYYKSIKSLQDKRFLVYTDSITSRKKDGTFVSANRAYCRYEDMTYLEDAKTHQVLYSKELAKQAREHGTRVIIDEAENERIDNIVQEEKHDNSVWDDDENPFK